jgi:predicted protein tyrosine phosphatase
MNILFVCSANKLRSKTADDHFSSTHPEENFMSAGTNHKVCMQEGTTPLEEYMLEWADKIYVMENKHLKIIRKHTNNKYSNKVTVLHIPDDYKYMQKELINLLEKKCLPF